MGNSLLAERTYAKATPLNTVAARGRKAESLRVLAVPLATVGIGELRTKDTVCSRFGRSWGGPTVRGVSVSRELVVVIL